MGEGKQVSRTYPAGNPTWLRDATANDSDKSFTVPANKRWIVRYIEMQISTTATVGNRAMYAYVYSAAGDSLAVSMLPTNVVASNSGRFRYVPPWGSYNVGTSSQQIIPFGGVGNELIAGQYIRVLDLSAIDAAADDMTVVLYYEELDV